MSILIQVSDALCRIGKKRTLQIEGFTLRKGEHWCLFGGNGSGKSLLAQLLQGQLLSGRRHVWYPSGFDPERDIVTVSFEEQQRLWEMDNRHDISEYNSSAQDPGTTVAALVLAGAPADQRYRELLGVLDLQAQEHQGIRFLSSGQVRKAMIARALFRDPLLIILDDPLESIDRDSRERITDAISRWRSPGNSSLLLSRRAGDIMPGSTHMAVLADMKIRVQGAFDEIRHGSHFAELFDRRPMRQMLPACPRQEAGDSFVPLIELRCVSASWGDRLILDQVNWTFRAGQHALIEGPNGCGKSTLLSLIDGENHKAYGQDVRLFGHRRGTGETVWEVKARFGVVSNELHNRYVRGWRVLDVAVSGFFDSVGLYDESGSSQQLAARAWLRALGVEDLAAEPYQELSFGQQRLVLLARAMVKCPQILILDEPLVGLDDWHRDLILQTLDAIAAVSQTQLIYVSHTAGEHPGCINQTLRFIPCPSPQAGQDPGSTRSMSRYRLEIREAPPLP